MTSDQKELTSAKILSTSIDRYALACNELCLVGRQESNQLSHLIRLADSTQALSKWMGCVNAPLQELCVSFFRHSTGLQVVDPGSHE
jgi:hypothetical protein